ncbi:hypothetical protein [Pyxidicoccus trucidator]|uniref:hypothetical protein n=1 Tax=Pyxidicoccus trucidator TaxID=2709662 RepID=UPI0013D9EA65|nr:hypothetical protein [Pyxidicoccus trucidator]
MEDAVIHFYPGHTEHLLYTWPDQGEQPIRESRMLELALEVVDAFWPAILEPRVVTLDLVGVDDWGYALHPSVTPEPPGWLLRTVLPPGVKVSLGSSRYLEREVPALTRDVLRAWMEEALRQPPVGGADHLAWSELTFRATRVRVFEPERFAGRDTLVLGSEVGPVEVPLERDARGPWVSGPVERLADQPPIRLSLSRPDGGFEVSVNPHWSLWTQEGSPGKAALDAAITHLLTRGWERDPQM